MTGYKCIPFEEFDATLRPFLNEVSSSSYGAKVLSCSDDFFVSKDNLIKPTPSLSMKGQFGPNGALYDGWESRRHNPTFDWVIILLAPPLSHLHYVDIDTSHFSGNEAPESQVFALRLDPGPRETVKISPNDNRWTEILPVVGLGPNSRHIFELGKEGKEGVWSALMVRMIPDGGMARFRAYGHPLPPPLLPTLPPTSTPPINLLDPLLSARIVACSDANFSPPGNLLLPGRGHDMSDGWETRRSQVGRGKYAKGGKCEGQERREWVVARLAGTGSVSWIEVDTAFHPGNYPVGCKVEAILSDKDLPSDDAGWTTLVEKKPLGPHRQHWFDVERNVPVESIFSHVRLTTYPDGGLKRLRIYGHPLAPPPPSTIIPEPTPALPPTIPLLPLTYEAFKPYGQVIQGHSFPSSAPKGIHVTTANQGTASKLHRLAKITHSYPDGLLKRGGTYLGSVRSESRLDIKDGKKIPIETLERHIHTSQAFIPMSKGVSGGTEALSGGGAVLVVVALNGKDDKPDMSTMRAFLATPAQGFSFDEGIWHHGLFTMDGPLDYAIIETQIGDAGSLLDTEKYTPPKPYAHIEIPPYTSVPPHTNPSRRSALPSTVSKLADKFSTILTNPTTTASPVPITPESFAPYGQIIKAHPGAAPPGEGMDVLPSPDGRTVKYAPLADITNTYPSDAGAVLGVSVFRASPKIGLERGKVFDIRFMERHPFTSQAFIPMGKAEWKGKGEEALKEGGEMLVIVALNGEDDRPDPKTLKTFIMPSSIGLSYAPGVWHHPTLILDETIDLACVETQISTGIPEPDPRDCELIEWEGEEVFGRVLVPALE